MKSNNRQTSPETGATLIEILVAVGIIATALVVLVLALSTGAKATRLAADISTATALAQSQMETIKAAPYNAAGTYPAIGTPAGFTVTIAVQELAVGKQLITVTVRSQGQVLAQLSTYKVDR